MKYLDRRGILLYNNGGGGEMSVTSDLIRGNTDTIILAILSEGDNYGYGINKIIRTVTRNEYELKEATLYIAFRRLEESGCISSYWGNEESGARRRYYSITEMGRKTYAVALAEWEKANAIIKSLIYGTGHPGKETI